MENDITHHVRAMLETHPKDLGQIDKDKLAECITACFECAQTCTACADACLGEEEDATTLTNRHPTRWRDGNRSGPIAQQMTKRRKEGDGSR